jgi:hypothetical protein
MVQFYESFKRATMEIYRDGITPEDYLKQHVWNLNNRGQNFMVAFDSDPELRLPSQDVPLPVSEKLAWGFGNGWAATDSDKNVYFPPECVQAAYQELWDWMLEPKDLMLWNIDQEGTNGVYYAEGLNENLHIRPIAGVVEPSVEMITPVQ